MTSRPNPPKQSDHSATWGEVCVVIVLAVAAFALGGVFSYSFGFEAGYAVTFIAGAALVTYVFRRFWRDVWNRRRRSFSAISGADALSLSAGSLGLAYGFSSAKGLTAAGRLGAHIPEVAGVMAALSGLLLMLMSPVLKQRAASSSEAWCRVVGYVLDPSRLMAVYLTGVGSLLLLSEHFPREEFWSLDTFVPSIVLMLALGVMVAWDWLTRRVRGPSRHLAVRPALPLPVFAMVVSVVLVVKQLEVNHLLEQQRQAQADFAQRRRNAVCRSVTLLTSNLLLLSMLARERRAGQHQRRTSRRG